MGTVLLPSMAIFGIPLAARTFYLQNSNFVYPSFPIHMSLYIHSIKEFRGLMEEQPPCLQMQTQTRVKKISTEYLDRKGILGIFTMEL